jgi:hypothetical protein
MCQLTSRLLDATPKTHSFCGVALKKVLPVSLPTDHLTEQDANNERRYTESCQHVHEGGGHKRPAHDMADHRHAGLKARRRLCVEYQFIVLDDWKRLVKMMQQLFPFLILR